MPGWNLKTYEEEFNSLIHLGALTATSPAAPNLIDAHRRINEALRIIGRKWGDQRTRNNSTTLTAATAGHAMPDDVFGRDIRAVYIKKTSSSKPVPLEYRDQDQFEALYDQGDTSDDSGAPKYWAYDPADPTQILLRPVPETTVSNGLIFSYAARPERLHRVFYHASATADATYNSTTVTINQGSSSSTAPITTAQIAANDEFAIIPTTRMDQTTHSLTMAGLYWERMTAATVSTSSTAVTLANAWGSDTVSGGKFITAQVPDLERMWPGEMGFSPSYIAAGFHILGRNPDKADVYLGMAAALLGLTVADLLGGHRRKPPLPDMARPDAGMLSSY